MILSRTDVLPMGMGCWAMGGQVYAGTEPLGLSNSDDTGSKRAIHATLDAGFRIFGTASIYGAGHLERLLGEALKDHPYLIIISKLGAAMDEDARQMLRDETAAHKVVPATEHSLNRPKRDHVDVMLLHLHALPLETARLRFEQMELTRQARKIRAYTWRTDFPESANAMRDLEGFVAVEHAMNTFVNIPSIQRTVSDNVFVALLPSPLLMGVPTGKNKGTAVIPKTDVHSVNSAQHNFFGMRNRRRRICTASDALCDLLQTGGRSLAQGALRWLLAKPDRIVPISGARTARQTEEIAAAAARGPLPNDAMAEIETLMDCPPEGTPIAY